MKFVVLLFVRLKIVMMLPLDGLGRLPSEEMSFFLTLLPFM